MIFGILADSRQMTLVMNPAVGCRYFLPGPWLPSELQIITVLNWYQFVLLGEQRHVCE